MAGMPLGPGYCFVPDGPMSARYIWLLDFPKGAVLGLAGTAAADAFDAGGIGEGTTVLVAGATGGVVSRPSSSPSGIAFAAI